MSTDNNPVDIVIPDIGDTENVEVIELLVGTGDEVALDDSLLTLESDKASMEVPATSAGVIESLTVSVGDTVNAGDVIGTMKVNSDGAESLTMTPRVIRRMPRKTPMTNPMQARMMRASRQTQVGAATKTQIRTKTRPGIKQKALTRIKTAATPGGRRQTRKRMRIRQLPASLRRQSHPAPAIHRPRTSAMKICARRTPVPGCDATRVNMGQIYR